MSKIDCENVKGMSLEELTDLVDSLVKTKPVEGELVTPTGLTGIRNLKLFWKILVDPCWGPDLQNVVKKEVSLWGQQDNSEGTWMRIMHWTFPMIVEICETEEECGSIVLKGMAIAENCQLRVENCYLRVLDPGLRYQASKMGLAFQGPDFAEALPVQVVETVKEYLIHIEDGEGPIAIGDCKKENNKEDDRPKCQFTVIDKELYYVGENIRLETEFTADTEGLHPIFLYPKFSELTVPERSFHEGMVYAHEKFGSDGTREATWVVSRRDVTCLDTLERKGDSESKGVYFSNPYLLAGQHLLIVSQDQNVEAPGIVQPYFEFLVDTIPIRTPHADDSTHLFYTGPQCFYIGYCPRLGFNDRIRIKRIMFDPNSSCYGC